MAKIGFIGGHGKIALLTHPLLVAGGHEVTAIIRKPEQADAVAATGASPLVFDIENAETAALGEVLSGHDIVIWSAGAGGGAAARTYAIDRDAAIASMNAAAHVGAFRYIMVSYLGASPGHGVAPENSFFAYAESKADADAYLRRSMLDYTILQPGALTDDAPSGHINPAAVPSQPDSSTSRGNVAAVIAAVVRNGDSVIGRSVPFTDGDVEISSALLIV